MKYHVANISKEMIEEMSKELNNINNVILISINDIGSSTKIENTNFFKNIYTFYFEDIEDEYVYSIYNKEDTIPIWAKGISDHQAKKIAKILLLSKNKHNILVHCHAGVSRSGAITEIAVDLGFKLYNFSNLRTINQTVYKKIKNQLSLKYKIFIYIKKIIEFFLKNNK